MPTVTKSDNAAAIRWWTDGVPVEDQARAQLERIATLPFIHRHVAVMPDVHLGKGATVGSVIATKGAVIPAAVGVDIGCGMMAVRTSAGAADLPTSLAALRSSIERAVPHGRTDNGGRNDRGARHDLKGPALEAWHSLSARYEAIVGKHPKLGSGNGANHMGTLGTGNHFIEVCLDEQDRVWAMLHSGSRGVGNRIGMYFIERAKNEMRRLGVDLPDAELAYLTEGAQHFDDYVLVTRKGAVSARAGELGIIPGSMGTRSYIVRGKGNADSFASCSHGAGRRMSRTQARKTFTLADHARAVEGVECRRDADVIDETPAAYKDIDAVMAAQTDLVDIVHTLRQVVCVKG